MEYGLLSYCGAGRGPGAGERHTGDEVAVCQPIRSEFGSGEADRGTVGLVEATGSDGQSGLVDIDGCICRSVVVDHSVGWGEIDVQRLAVTCRE